MKFKTIFEEKTEPKHKNIKELIRWGKKFSKLGLAPKETGGYAGNLSFRTFNGFMVTRTGADLGNLTEEDFTEVVSVDISKKEIFAKGIKEPSSESFINNEIYQRRHEINAIFHGHDELVLKYNDKLNLPITEKEQPHGSIKLMWEVIKILNSNNYLLIKNHGFVALGKTIDEAGKEALKQHNNAFKITKIFL